MAMSLNKVTLIGNVGSDPESRQMQNGNAVVSFRMATSERWRDREGEMREKTEWHRIVIFNKNLCDIAQRYIQKGSRIYVEGNLQTRKWVDNESVTRYTTEIALQFGAQLIMLDARGDSGFSDSPMGGRETARREPLDHSPEDRTSLSDDLDDAIPF